MDVRDTQALGQWGENLAADFLGRQGLHIVDQRYSTRWGEIDLIALDRETWVFVEVKTRSQVWQPSAADALNRSKQRKLVNAALSYMKKNALEGENMRFDAILIEAGLLEWIPDAFEPESHYTF